MRFFYDADQYAPLKIAYWFLLKGRAYLKRQLAKRVRFDPATFSYNRAILELILQAKKEGRKVYLATATDEKIAQVAVNYLKIFDGVFASDGIINLRAQHKANRLVMEFGPGQFIYAGNSTDDLKVWTAAGGAIVCPDSRFITLAVRKMGLPHLVVPKVFDKIDPETLKPLPKKR
jgi:hypothetical protein